MSILLGYVRVSGKAQAGKRKDEEATDKDGPIRQQEAIAKFCSQNGAPAPEFFSDLGVSGTVEGLDRPGLFNLLLAAESGSASGVVVENLNRLARDLVVQEMFCRELRKRNLALYATDQGMVDLTLTDTDPSRKLIRQIFGVIAEFEKSTLVIKLRVARERKKKATGKCEGKRGFGEGNCATAKAERIILNTIFELRKEGQEWSRENRPATWRTIAILFQQYGFKKRNGKTNWEASQICRIWKRHKKRQRKIERLKHEHLPGSGSYDGIKEILRSGVGQSGGQEGA